MNSESNENTEKISNDYWEAEVLGQIYGTNFAELTQWIAEGALLPDDKVRRGNLRFLEAKKVPLLIPFFNAKEQGIEPPTVQTKIIDAGDSAESVPVQPENLASDQNLQENADIEQHKTPQKTPPPPQYFPAFTKSFCEMHPDTEAKYFCQTCGNSFCRLCPTSYGGNVKLCPICGALCKTIAETKVKKHKEIQHQLALTEGFGFLDFGRALIHPFRFKASLFFGAIMFMFFTLGQSAATVGGLFLIAASIICFMLANMLTFGILANTIDNFTQGRLDANFMPNFDDFSLWDDVVHPFFLSIGAYLSSFGPFILIVLIAGYVLINSMVSQVNSIPENLAKNTYPQPFNAEKVNEQSQEVKRLLEQIKQNNAKNKALEDGNINIEQLPPVFDDTEEQVMQAQELIEQARKEQLESVAGSSPVAEQKYWQEMMKNFMSMALPFLFLLLISFLWGMFYFPAACAVAGYTRSFLATINPLIGLDTIKRLGIDYAKIWLMGLIIVIWTAVISGILNLILSPFDMPRVGNIPATAIGSLFTFYLSVVFSCVLGYALYKASNRLNLYKG